MQNEELQTKISFQPTQDGISLQVRLEDDTVWLTQKQMAMLFDKDVNTIGEHIQVMYKEGELEQIRTTRKFRVVRIEGDRNRARDVTHYNLDVIISVGYRVKSKRGTEFRIWAISVLRDQIVKGYSINEQRLALEAKKYHELQTYLKTLKRVNENEDFSLDDARGLIHVITEYASGLELLERFDSDELTPRKKLHPGGNPILYHDAISEINVLREKLGAGGLFGLEKDGGFKSAIANVFQTFAGDDLYPTIEEKAANLLYLIIRNHGFVDGNKRIGSFMFLRFLDINGKLYRANGEKIVAENALVAMALLVAQSKPEEKDQMVNLVVNLL